MSSGAGLAAGAGAVIPDDPELLAKVQKTFAEFCAFGYHKPAEGSSSGGSKGKSKDKVPTSLDGAKFAKLCRECGIIGGNVNSTSVDLAFAKHKGTRKLNFEEFKLALLGLAPQRFPEHNDEAVAMKAILQLVASIEGPQANNTTEAIAPSRLVGEAGEIGHTRSFTSEKPTSTTLPLDGELRDIFLAFASFGASSSSEASAELDGAKFAKFCRDTKIQGKKVSSTTVDLTFAKFKQGRKMKYRDFETALRTDIAPLRYPPSADDDEDASWRKLKELVKSAEGPTTTGVTVVSTAGVFGRVTADAPDPAEAAAARQQRSVQPSPKPKKVDNAFKEIFNDFSAFGNAEGSTGDLDGAQFAKLCRDTKIQGKAVNSTTADLAFAKYKSGRKLDYTGFVQALAALAPQRYPKAGSEEEAWSKMKELVLRAEGPSMSGVTKAKTGGVYGRVTDSSNFTGTAAASGGYDESRATSRAPSNTTNLINAALEGAPDLSMAATFNAYAQFGHEVTSSTELSSAQFAKLCRDCKIITKSVTTTDTDIAFSKAKDKEGRRLDYAHFVAALHVLAERRFPKAGSHKEAVAGITKLVTSCKGPSVQSATTPEMKGIYSRLADSNNFIGASKVTHSQLNKGKRSKRRSQTKKKAAAAQAASLEAKMRAAEEREAQARAAFKKYDKDNSGDIDIVELQTMLVELGFPESAVQEEYVKANKEGKAAIGFEAFVGYYNQLRTRLPRASSRGKGKGKKKARGDKLPLVAGSKSSSVRAAAGTGSEPLKKVFLEFARFGKPDSEKEMDNSHFAKLTRECGLVHKSKCTSTDIDIIFNKIKPRSARKITFAMFQEALKLIAVRLYPKKETDEAVMLVEALVVETGHPGSKSTKASTKGVYSKLTDSSQYTGTHHTPTKPTKSPRRSGTGPIYAGRKLKG